jgi:hypothetical protein
MFFPLLFNSTVFFNLQVHVTIFLSPIKIILFNILKNICFIFVLYLFSWEFWHCKIYELLNFDDSVNFSEGNMMSKFAHQIGQPKWRFRLIQMKFNFFWVQSGYLRNIKITILSFKHKTLIYIHIEISLYGSFIHLPLRSNSYDWYQFGKPIQVFSSSFQDLFRINSNH